MRIFASAENTASIDGFENSEASGDGKQNLGWTDRSHIKNCLMQADPDS